jgi:hypothetical protein
VKRGDVATVAHDPEAVAGLLVESQGHTGDGRDRVSGVLAGLKNGGKLTGLELSYGAAGDRRAPMGAPRLGRDRTRGHTCPRNDDLKWCSTQYPFAVISGR